MLVIALLSTLFFAFCSADQVGVGRGLTLHDATSQGLNNAGANSDNYKCQCNPVPGNLQGQLQCTCNPLPPGQRPIPADKDQGPNAGPDQKGGPVDDSNCPLACPAGWDTWGFSQNCYHIPAQPVKLDSFWAQQEYCKQTDPTSNLLVVNDLIEQALGTAVAIQYAPTWLATLTNSFIWLGGYNKGGAGWKFMDGTDQSNSVLMIAANLANYVGTTGDDTCIGADPKTLGVWQTRPCKDTTGAAFCEMPKRRVCGAKGGSLPISPVRLTKDSLMNLFPKSPSIPFLGQILDDTFLGSSLWGFSDALTESNVANPNKCPMACPAGWNQWGFTDHCYLMPTQPVKQNTFWNLQKMCKDTEPTSNIIVINGLVEQALGTAVSLQYAANWIGLLGNGFLWIGGYTSTKGWQFLDGTDQSSSVLMIAANLIGGTKNNTCLGADPKTLGVWQTYPCDDKTGAAICEMPKRPVCGEKGGMLPISNVDLTPSGFMNLFPKTPSLPFIGSIFGSGGFSNIFNVQSAVIGSNTGQKFGDTTSYVMCVKQGGSAGSKPTWEWLKLDGKDVEVPGKWLQTSCSYGSVTPFLIQPSTYLALWNRCLVAGFELPQPANQRFSDWYPFQVESELTDYYRANVGWGGRFFASYDKMIKTPVSKC